MSRRSSGNFPRSHRIRRPVPCHVERATMPAETSTASPVVMREIPLNGDGQPLSNQPSTPRHLLEFEKPLFRLEQQIQELEALQATKQVDYTKELRQLRNNYTSLLRKTYGGLTAWETVQVARHPQRPLFKDYVELICREFR